MPSSEGIECTDSRPVRSAVVTAPTPSAAPGVRRATRGGTQDPVLSLCAVEERLDAARRENEHLKNRNRQLARALADAKQRGIEAHRLAHHDALTGLPNRLLLIERLQDGISTALRNGRKLVLLFIDLDHFKCVNDRFGHAAGDKLLVIVASRILSGIRANDTAFRYGGDEFVVLMSDIGDAEAAGSIAEKIRGRIAGRYGIDDKEVEISASVGLAVYPEHGDHRDALIRHADASMYRCKADRTIHGESGPASMIVDHVGNDVNPAGETARGAAARGRRVSAVASA